MRWNIRIKPHGTTPGQLEALASTLKMLAGGGDLARDETGAPHVDVAGWVGANVQNPGFVAFACKHQGYALDAVVP